MLRKRKPKLEVKSFPLGHIERVLNSRQHRVSRIHNRHEDMEYVIHVSDLIKSSKQHEFCPRYHALLHTKSLNKRITGQVPPGAELLFAFGNTVHELVRNKFMQRSEFGKWAFGNWRCPCNQLQYEYRTQPPASSLCKACGKPAHIYEEIDLVDGNLRIFGHPDFLVFYNGVYYLYEIKTIERADIDFNSLDAPLGDHVLQASFYYWMLRTMGFKVHPVIRFIYVDRSTKKMFGGNIYKEFAVKRSDRERMFPFIRKAMRLKKDFDANRVPKRICPNSKCTRAKSCDLVVECFSRNSTQLRSCS